MKKIERLLTIVLALKSRGRMTAADLASLLEVTVRTVYRDIDALSQMEVPVLSSPGSTGGYEIMDDYFLPAVTFSSDEILALQIGKKLLDTVEIPGFSPQIESAFLKLDDSIDSRRRRENQKVLDRIFFNLADVTPSMEKKRYFHLIRSAMAENRNLWIRYYSPNKLTESEREIEPRVLSYYEGAWYLHARCLAREAERTFRLDRIMNLKLTGNTFTLPAGFDFKRYDRKESYRRDVLKKGEGTRILLKISLPLLERDKDKLLLAFYDIHVKDGWGYWEVNTRYPEDFIDYAVRHHEDVEILEPQAIRDRLKEKVQKILAKY